MWICIPSQNEAGLITLTILQTPLLRYHALLALKKSLDAAKRAVSESAFKDILKQMKSSLSDKCLPVERAAAEVGFLPVELNFNAEYFYRS